MTHYTDLYLDLYLVPPPKSVDVGGSDADVLSPSRGFMSRFDFTLQLMVGCPAGCAFCYVRSAPRLAPADVRGQSWGYRVRRKRNAVEKFAKHLQSGSIADCTIYWSGVTDPYASEPSITRAIWEKLLAVPSDLRPRRIAVQTRYPVDRDVEIIAEYSESSSSRDCGPPVVISYSLGTDRDDLIRAWEKATPLFEKRMKTLEALAGRGLFVVATLSPMALWNDLPGSMQRLKEAGVRYITILFFKEHMRGANTPPEFAKYLRSHYPMLLDAQWQQERLLEVQEVWGCNRVLVGQEGFASLACPHKVMQIQQPRYT